jgi:hypothetical protein
MAALDAVFGPDDLEAYAEAAGLVADRGSPEEVRAFITREVLIPEEFARITWFDLLEDVACSLARRGPEILRYLLGRFDFTSEVAANRQPLTDAVASAMHVGEVEFVEELCQAHALSREELARALADCRAYDLIEGGEVSAADRYDREAASIWLEGRLAEMA